MNKQKTAKKASKAEVDQLKSKISKLNNQLSHMKVVSGPALGSRALKRSQLAEDYSMQKAHAAETLETYIMSMLDPAHVKGRIPSPLSLPTATFSVTYPVTQLKPNANGEIVIVVRGGLMNFFAANTFTVPLALVGIHTYNQFGGTMAAPITASQITPTGAATTLANVAPYLVYEMCPAPDIQAIRDTFSQYRKVSQIVSCEYAGPPISAQGTVAVGLWPGSYALPRAFAPAPIFSQSSGPLAVPDLTFDAVAALEGAEIYRSFDEITALWRPMGPMDQWRPIKHVVPFSYSSAFGIESAPICDENPASFIAQLESIASFSQASVLGAGVPGALLNGWSNMSTRPTSLDFADPAVVYFYTGLAPTALVNLTITVNYEAICDQRSWSLAEAAARISDQAELHRAANIMASVPHSHTGKHSEWLTKIKSGVMQAIRVSKDVIGTARQVAPVASSVLKELGMSEASEAVSSLAAVDSLAGLAELFLI